MHFRATLSLLRDEFDTSCRMMESAVGAGLGQSAVAALLNSAIGPASDRDASGVPGLSHGPGPGAAAAALGGSSPVRVQLVPRRTAELGEGGPAALGMPGLQLPQQQQQALWGLPVGAGLPSGGQQAVTEQMRQLLLR